MKNVHGNRIGGEGGAYFHLIVKWFSAYLRATPLRGIVITKIKYVNSNIKSCPKN